MSLDGKIELELNDDLNNYLSKAHDFFFNSQIFYNCKKVTNILKNCVRSFCEYGSSIFIS